VQLAILLVCLPQLTSAQHPHSLYYGGADTWSIERNYLDNFADWLRVNKNTVGLILYRPGKKDCLIDVKRRIDRAVRYLTTKRKISKDRILTFYGGPFEELSIELGLLSKEKVETVKYINIIKNHKQNLNDYIKADKNCKARRKIVKRKKTL
jgi:hypothetical protein